MKETTTELPVPEEALMRLVVCDEDRRMHEPAETCARAIAAPIVAAVLRELADQTKDRREVTGAPSYRDGYFDGANSIRDLLIDRADELDPRA